MAKKPKRDPKREKRITMEVVVECYDRDEVAMGWYYYLESQLRPPRGGGPQLTIFCVGYVGTGAWWGRFWALRVRGATTAMPK